MCLIPEVFGLSSFAQLYSMTFWSYQIHIIVFSPNRLRLAIDVSSYPESTLHTVLGHCYSKFLQGFLLHFSFDWTRKAVHSSHVLYWYMVARHVYKAKKMSLTRDRLIASKRHKKLNRETTLSSRLLLIILMSSLFL